MEAVEEAIWRKAVKQRDRMAVDDAKTLVIDAVTENDGCLFAEASGADACPPPPPLVDDPSATVFLYLSELRTLRRGALYGCEDIDARSRAGIGTPFDQDQDQTNIDTLTTLGYFEQFALPSVLYPGRFVSWVRITAAGYQRLEEEGCGIRNTECLSLIGDDADLCVPAFDPGVERAAEHLSSTEDDEYNPSLESLTAEGLLLIYGSCILYVDDDGHPRARAPQTPEEWGLLRDDG